MDEDWEWDPDVTGDPQLDQFGYQSPRNVPRTWAHPPASERDWLAQSRRDRAERQRKRDQQQRQREEARRRRESPPSQPVAKPVVAWPPEMDYRPGMGPQRPGPLTPPAPVEQQSRGPLLGQHGAYFEVRTKRVWYSPWRKRKVWQQISAWHMGLPPAGTTVVTVPDVAALPGQVHTIGRVSGTGAVEY
jgi:hypothetical protein